MSDAPFKNFDEGRDREAELKQPGPRFQLCGETFECKPKLPASAAQKITQTVNFGGQKTAVPDIIDAIRGALRRRKWTPRDATDEDSSLGTWTDTDDVARFDDIVSPESDWEVDSEELGDVIGWLMSDAYGGGRPTQRSRR